MKSIPRGKRLTGKFHLTRWGIVALVVLVALGSIGVTYAGIRGPKPKDNTVTTVNSNAHFSWVVSNDDGTEENGGGYEPIDPGDDHSVGEYDYWGSLSSNDPGSYPPPANPPAPGGSFPRYTQDVARTTASIETDSQYITVTLENAYPYYYPTVFFGIINEHSSPGIIQNIVIYEDATIPGPNLIDELTVTVSGIEIGDEILAGGEAMGALHIHVEQAAEQNHTYTIRVEITIVGTLTEKHGTAYAYGGEGIATCFLDIGEINTKRWGWTNGPLSAGSYEFDMYAGVGGCEATDGTLVGTVTVVYDGGTATVTYTMDAGFTMGSTHLYVGNEPLPKNKKGDFTVAPGQYPYQHTHDSGDSSTYTYTVNDLFGEIYVVAHAVVYWFP